MLLLLEIQFGEIWFILLNAYISDGQAYIIEGQSDFSQPYDFRVWMGDFGMVNNGGLSAVWLRDSNILYL